MIISGDVGGTKCNLALYAHSDGNLRQVTKHRYESGKFASFEKVVAQFLDDIAGDLKTAGEKEISAAAFGVAGPVIHQRVKVTNLPWTVDASSLAQQIPTKHIVLLNDLQATGYSLFLLGPDEIAVLNPGEPSPQSAQALLAAGTGLGEALLFWNRDRYIVVSSEGGHADFAPRTEQEISLLRHLKKQHEFVSVELILSGRGFRAIHEFLDASVRHSSFDDPHEDAAPEITHLGLSGECLVCVQTLDLWTSIYGAEAGNLALKALTRGGVWIAGGIAVKIRKKMEDGTFFRAFCAKEKFGPVLQKIPVRMVLNEEAPLLGAASQAARAAEL